MNNNLVSMSHVFYRALRAVFSSKNVRLSLPCLLLAGCVTHAPKSAISHKQEDKWPQKQLADFLSTRCDDIWSLSGRDVESNPLFWLRGIDCAQRLAPAEPMNDGKQTPMRGHPVFIAQHATATCCRGCLEKWHAIPHGRALSEQEQRYVVQVIHHWLVLQMNGPSVR